MRGEYEVFQHRATNGEELPPRARRIRKNIPVHCHGLGTTSACAENTAAKNHFILFNRNYLRVRGEYRYRISGESSKQELPPRARRIHCVRESIRVKTGTTSACAENTGRYSCWSSRIRNYLRVRGEYPISRNRKGSLSELPPRARRIPRPMRCQGTPLGTTSACAENTRTRRLGSCATGNYLRVRGEYKADAYDCFIDAELPPRARRIHGVLPKEITTLGTTSACAENTQ